MSENGFHYYETKPCVCCGQSRRLVATEMAPAYAWGWDGAGERISVACEGCGQPVEVERYTPRTFRQAGPGLRWEETTRCAS